MIAFDNGPRDGDYVRYIEDLVAARAAQLGAGATLPPTPGDTSSRAMPMLPRPSRDPATTTGTATSPRARPTAPITPAAAAAIAQAMMSGRQAPMPTFALPLGAASIGIALVLLGVFATTFNAALVIGGVALLSWAFKSFANAAAGMSKTRRDP